MVGAVLRALSPFDDPSIPGQALARLGMLAPSCRSALVDLLAARPGSAAVLLDAVVAGVSGGSSDPTVPGPIAARSPNHAWERGR